MEGSQEAEVTRPVREVCDCATVDLGPGESREVTFVLAPDRLGYHGRDLAYRTDPGTFVVWIAPDASGTPTAFALS